MLMKTNYLLRKPLKGWIAACCLLSFSLCLSAQSQTISVNIKEQPLNKALQIIAEKADLKVAYSKEFIDIDKPVSISASNERLDKVLNTLFKKMHIGYRIQNGSLLLYRKTSAQNGNEQMGEEADNNENLLAVTGTVTDSNGEPVIGATVSATNAAKNINTVTDTHGQFSIRVKSGTQLRFNYIGCSEAAYTVKKEGNISIVLHENTTGLDEVVVVAYGTQKKINLTGAVSMVKGDVLENRPVTSVGKGLQGELPGVSIINSTGKPGTSPSIVIRGVSTINSSTAPLILIDGVAGGDINLLNPDDIASVSVLKDAASASIYGARAANGVILVTTKTGKANEQPTLTYSGYVGWQTPTRLPKLVNGRQFMELSNEAMQAAGYSAPYNASAFQKYDSGNYPNDYSNTDWIDQIYKKTALQTNHELSVRGGSNKSSYAMSYGYLNQDGLIVGDGYKSHRHNARINLTTRVFDRLKINGNLSYIDFARQDIGYSGTSGVFRLAQRISPLLPVKWQHQNPDGTWSNTDWYAFGTVKNPVDVAYNSGFERRNTRVFNGIVNAGLNLMKGLDLNGQYSVNYYSRETNEFNPAMLQFFQDGTPSPNNTKAKNFVSKEQENNFTQSLQTTLNFNRVFARKHDVALLLGYSQEWETHSPLSGSRKNILIDGVQMLSSGTEDITNSGNEYAWALRSYFGRINYVYDSRYLFEANMRIDGTSRFAKENRWGYFPSFSTGWNFSREQFMKWADAVLSAGKIRLSWGELGNQNVGSYYPYLTPIERVEKSYPIGGTNNVGFKQLSLGNYGIKWETIRMLNIGIDLSFLNNRLTTTFEWYKKNNVNALVRPVYPSLVGITKVGNLPFENIGEVENKGWEWWIQWRDKIGEVSYSAAFNISDSRNKIKNLGKSAPSLTDYIRKEGEPIDAFYGYLTDGLAQISDFKGVDGHGKYIQPKFATPVDAAGIVQPGDIKYRDLNGDNVIDEKDKVVFGDQDPHYLLSFKGSVAWRNFDFSFYMQGVAKWNGYLSDEARHCFINDYSVPKVEHLDRWTPTNPGAKYPRLYQAQTHNLLFSDYWMEDASYLRMKNVQLGYTVPKTLLGLLHLPLKVLKMYFSVDNLFTITNYFGAYDPEVRTSSGDAYPQVKTFTFGLRATF